MNGQYYEGDTVLHNWTLTKKLGEGSFGKVYEAERTEFGVTYKAAIKIITIPQNESEIKSARAEGMDEASLSTYFYSMVENMIQEISLMSQLKGTAHVVSYEDHAVIPHRNNIGWDILIRMEKLIPFLDYMEEREFSRQDVIKLGVDMCRALELCQRYNIIHRDIKPENIFVSKTGDFKLGDFGIARTMERTSGSLSKKGTYTYMAPEVYKEERYGSNVDTYSLGIVMYRLLNNNRGPFLPEYPKPISYAAREKAIVKRIGGAELPYPANEQGRLAEIVLKACAYKPKDRYSSPVQMRQELEALRYARSDERIYEEAPETPVPQKEKRKKSRTAEQGGRHEASVSAGKSYARVSGTHAPPNSGGLTSQKKPIRYLGKLVGGAVAAVIIIITIFLFFKSSENKQISNPEITPQHEVDIYDKGTSTAAQDGTGESVVREDLYDSDGNVNGWVESKYSSSGWTESKFNTKGEKFKTTEYNADGSVSYWTGFEYDTAGNLIKEVGYNNDGSLDYFSKYEYSDAALLVKETIYNSDGSLSSLKEYNSEGKTVKAHDYDEKGHLIKETNYSSDGSISSEINHKYTYYENGNIEIDYEYDAEGKEVYTYHNLTGNVVYSEEYDMLGNKTKTIEYRPDGNIKVWTEHEYDTSGILVKSVRHSSDGRIALVEKYEYDSIGNIVKSLGYDATGNLLRVTEYNAGKKIKQTEYYPTRESIRSWTNYEYDSEGNLKKEMRYSSSGYLESIREY